MISVVSGLPGGGKGIYLIRSIVRQLVQTRRFVVTNLPVDLGKLNAHLQERYPEQWDSDIHDRIRLLREDEVFCFYRIRRGGLVLSPDSDWKIRQGELDKRQKLDRPQFVEEMKEIFRELEGAEKDQQGGVDYFIDEAHNFFDAREWQDVGRALTYYTTQHRHLDDNVWFASQNPEQLEGRLRMLAAERAECRNFYQERWGAFKRKGRFRVSFYHRCPKSLDAAQPFQRLQFSLDKGEADCYATTGALGVGSGEAESERKIGGLPWWGVPGLCAAGIVAVVGLIWFLPTVIGAGMGSLPGGVSGGVEQALGGEKAEVVAVSAAERVEREAVELESAESQSRVTRGRLVGYYRSMRIFGDEVRVELETGEVLTERDAELELVTRDFVQIEGVRYFPASRRAIQESEEEEKRSM